MTCEAAKARNMCYFEPSLPKPRRLALGAAESWLMWGWVATLICKKPFEISRAYLETIELLYKLAQLSSMFLENRYHFVLIVIARKNLLGRQHPTSVVLHAAP